MTKLTRTITRKAKTAKKKIVKRTTTRKTVR